jgi:hypothetical protein
MRESYERATELYALVAIPARVTPWPGSENSPYTSDARTMTCKRSAARRYL